MVVVRHFLVLLLVGLAGGWSAALRHGAAEPPGAPRLAALASRPAAWSSEDLPLDAPSSKVLGADATLRRVYRNREGAEVTVFLAYFARQQVNSQIHSPRNCLPGGGWNVERFRPVAGVPGCGEGRIASLRIGRAGKEQEVLYWFRTRGGTLYNEYGLKWDLLRHALAREPQDATFIRISAAAADTIAMHALLRELGPSLDGVLREVGL
jgi:EpsI family protein